ncbi:hypothetical protein DFH28DRAFT_903281 [Melampsora americana]|nr:hypothetical protein DFH28DRAFT_903281 [Melampsora americana]
MIFQPIFIRLVILLTFLQTYHSSLTKHIKIFNLIEQFRGSRFELICKSEKSLRNWIREIIIGSCLIEDEDQNSLNQNSQFDSNGLIYKFDEVILRPRLNSLELHPFEDLHGFVEQRCYGDQTDSTKDLFCIYLNYGFDQGRGMVIVCRQSMIKSIVKRLFKSEIDLPNQHNPNSGRLNVIDMPEKGGKGVKASKKYLMGDSIINTYPTLIVTLEDQLWDLPEAFDLEKTMVDYLPIHTRSQIATLHGKGETEVSWMESVFQRNGFQLRLGSQPYLALFPDASRVNHDCRPNVIYHIDRTSLKLNMYAARQIELGQELVIAYLDIQQPTETRRAQLRKHYGFECQCSICSLPEPSIQLSDSRLNQIERLTKTLNDWSSRSKANTSLAEDLLRLYELEGLEIYLADPYASLAVRYNAIKDLDKARFYASLAILHQIRIGGPSSSNLKDMITLRDSPETHWSYDYRYEDEIYYNFCQCGTDGTSLFTKSILCLHQVT